MSEPLTKDPAASLDYTIDWTPWLAGGETIVSSAWTVPSDLVAGASSHTGTSATQWISGGVNGVQYTITNSIVTSAGRSDNRSLSLLVQEQSLSAPTSPTARELITDAMKLIGVLAAGQTPRADEALDALSRMNDILEVWTLQRLMVGSVSRQTFTLTPGQQRYTLGLGGDFGADRPSHILGASTVSTVDSGDELELSLRVYTDQQWQERATKSSASSRPEGVWFNATYPLAECWFWPVPRDASVRAALYLPVSVRGPVTLDTVMVLPPGYKKALRYALAVELSSEFGRQIPPLVMKIAAESKAAILSMNDRPSELRCDNALVAGNGRFSILTGGFR